MVNRQRDLRAPQWNWALKNGLDGGDLRPELCDQRASELIWQRRAIDVGGVHPSNPTAHGSTGSLGDQVLEASRGHPYGRTEALRTHGLRAIDLPHFWIVIWVNHQPLADLAPGAGSVGLHLFLDDDLNLFPRKHIEVPSELCRECRRVAIEEGFWEGCMVSGLGSAGRAGAQAAWGCPF